MKRAKEHGQGMGAFAARYAAAALISLTVALAGVPAAFAQHADPVPPANIPGPPGAPPGMAPGIDAPPLAPSLAPPGQEPPAQPATDPLGAGDAAPLPLSPVLPKPLDPGALLKGTTAPSSGRTIPALSLIHI